MAYASKVRQAITAILVVVCTAAMIWFGNGLDPVWPLMWLAMLPVLWFALRSSWWIAAIVAASSMLLGGLNMWNYLHHVLGAPALVWVIAFLSAAIVFAASVLLFRALMLRGAVWGAMIALPAAWSSLEYIRNLTTPHGTAGSLAYSQLHFLPFLQLASITGPWGMSFILLLFPSTVAIAIHLRRSQRGLAVRVLSVGLSVIAAVLIFGAIRLAQPEGKTVRVGLISSDERGYATVSDPGAPTEKLFRGYAVAIDQLSAQGVRAIVLPEKLGVILDPDRRLVDAIFQAKADETGATIIAGAVYVAAPFTYNAARIYTPHAAVASYEKHHMLPPFESNLKPGTTIQLLPQAQQTWGVAICKDMDFTGLSRRYGAAGAGMMLVPAWDFNIDRAWHGHIAIMRGVEDGFSIVRSAKGGYLTVSDSRGRILAETLSDSAPFATLVADVPVEHRPTLYVRWGDWFPWVAFAAFGMAVVSLFLPRRFLR